jgi:ankyrin repeat protein
MDINEACEYLKYNDLYSIKKFVENKVNCIVNKKVKKRALDNILNEACIIGNLRFVKYLISVGANAANSNNGPVRWAAANGHLDVVKYLMTIKNVDVTSMKNYAIRNAIENNSINVVKYILNEIDFKDYNDIVNVIINIFKYDSAINHNMILYLMNDVNILKAIVKNKMFHELSNCFVLFLAAKFNVNTIDELKKVIEFL